MRTRRKHAWIAAARRDKQGLPSAYALGYVVPRLRRWLFLDRSALLPISKVGYGTTMRTRLRIDEGLIEEVRKSEKHKTAREIVTVALHEYVQRRKQLPIISIFGTIEY